MKIGLSKKVLASMFLAGLAPGALIGFILITKMEEGFRVDSRKKMTAVKNIKQHQVKDLIETMRNQIKTQSSNTLVVEAMNKFKNNFDNIIIDNNYQHDDIVKFKNNLKTYYKDHFEKSYLEKNSKEINSMKLLDKLSDVEIAHQYHYISNNSNPLGEKEKLDSSNDLSKYSKVHQQYHGDFRNYLNAFGYYDIFLVEPNNGHIVYSVYKELDYGTSLLNGPYSETNFGRAFKKALNMNKGDGVYITDLERYTPSYEAPASFISSPIMENGKIIGVLIFQIPIEKIDTILTSSKKWKASGLRETGEVYFVGSDNYARSYLRSMSREKESLLNHYKDSKYHTEMKVKESTTLTAFINDSQIASGFEGESGSTYGENYLGKRVLKSYVPFKFGEASWVLVAEIEENEALGTLFMLRELALWVLGAGVFIVCLFAMFFARSVSRQLSTVSEQLNDGVNASFDTSSSLLKISKSLSEVCDEQNSSVQESVAAIEEIRGMTRKTTENLSDSRDSAKKVREKTNEGERIVQEMSHSMTSIRESNTQLKEIVTIISKISEKTNVINDIVFKTQLLSFNASIEAARAGQHGKGFAVVAEEVGNLATMSGDAAKEITSLLESSKKNVNEIVVLTEERTKNAQNVTGKTVNAFVDISKEIELISNQIENIHDAAKEQDIGMTQTSVAVNRLGEAASKTSHMAGDLNDLSNVLGAKSELLLQAMDRTNEIVSGSKKAMTLTDKSKEENLDQSIPLISSEIESSVTDENIIDLGEVDADDESFKEVS